ncbi:hypothetical protein T4D_7935 [Trichinella pseudospiralis]|uniref:Uncharacterized protein n=1 Tax=Trichinella pseudospiralis TaxID=6337 RepID=A0A0V1FFB8_TRIPS|nr:hypothetical protein T4D_7935 [Trichinella pseudospiralis]
MNVICHAVHTNNAKPTYHITPTGTVELLLNKMIHHDVVELLCSPWASPIMLIIKKDGSCTSSILNRRHVDTLPGLRSGQRLLIGGNGDAVLREDAFINLYGLYSFKMMPLRL